MRASRTELLLLIIYYGFLNPVNPTARSRTYANIDTLSRTRYYIHFDVQLWVISLPSSSLLKVMKCQ